MAIGTQVWFVAPAWTTGNRPSVVVKGMIGYNVTSGFFEGYNGTTWTDLSGGGGGSGDSISVNGSAAVDANFNDTTPSIASPDLNVKWQKSGSGPASVSAYVDVVDLATILIANGAVGTFVSVGAGSSLSVLNLDDSTPAAPNANDVNVHWQESGGVASAYIDGDEMLDALGDQLDPRFGDGRDGTHTCSGNETLTGDVLYTTLNLAGFTIDTQGFKIQCRVSLTFAGGTIKSNGANASGTGSAGGAAASTGGSLGISGAGNSGGNNAAGANVSAVSDMWAQWETADGTSGKGGVGGISGTGRAGGTVGAVSGSQAAAGRSTDFLHLGLIKGRATEVFLKGGQGGSGGGGDSAFGGGGGGGGGIIVVCARHVDASGGGTIQANGGNGATSTATNGGGGGGGGGGTAWLLYETSNTLPTIQATGGTKGAKTGSGVVGTNGGDGKAIAICTLA